MFQLKLLIVLILIGGGAGGYFYVQKLQADLKISEANNVKLESAVGEQQAFLVPRLRVGFPALQPHHVIASSSVRAFGRTSLADRRWNRKRQCE